MSTAPDVRREIEENRRHWQRKRLLRTIYSRFYGEIAARLRPGPTLELGSGIGQIREFLPQCITSDQFPNPGIERVELAYALSFAPRSLSNIVLLDVWHHLEFPSAALREFHRVLVPGGRVVILDPAMGVIPRMVYELFHHEPVAYRQPIRWQDAPPSSDPPGYFAAQSHAWRMFIAGEADGHLGDWRIRERRAWSDFAYLASGGYSKPAFYPNVARPLVEGLDRVLTKVSPRLFAARMLVVLEKP